MIQSLDRGLSILEYLSKRKSAGVTEIAGAFGIDKSSVSRILRTLSAHDMVCKNPDNQKYSLSIGPLLFSYHIAARHSILHAAQPILRELAEETRETAHVCALHNNQIFLIDQVKSAKNRFMKDPALPGMTEPFHCSAVGKCMLAYMQPGEARRILERSDLLIFTEKTVCDIPELLRQLDDIRAKGYATDEQEYRSQVCCAAVPVFDEYDCATYSLGLSGTERWFADEARFSHNLECLREAGRKLTQAYRSIRQTDESL